MPSSRLLAEARVATALTQPGFVDYPQGFIVDEYVIDQHEWTSGFVEDDGDGYWQKTESCLVADTE